MDESINSALSSASNNLYSKLSDEESGWTMYFEEFMQTSDHDYNYDHDHKCDYACNNSNVVATYFSSSTVSDAASCVEFKPSINAGAEASKRFEKMKMKKKCCGDNDDDPLQDTASSPLNYCHEDIVDLKCMNITNLNKSYYQTLSQDGANSKNDHSQLKEMAHHGFNAVERAEKCENLEKRGLCLVPMSMLVDYL